MKLSYDESVDYSRFCEGGEMPENAKIGIRPVLYILRFLGQHPIRVWSGFQTISIFFTLGRSLYERHRVVPRRVATSPKQSVDRRSSRERV